MKEAISKKSMVCFAAIAGERLNDQTGPLSKLHSPVMLSESNPPRTLEYLLRYASHQEDLIRPLLNPTNFYLQRTRFEAWEQLHSSAWGKHPDYLDTTEPVIRDSDATNNQFIFPDVVPSDRSVMSRPTPLGKCWNFRAEKFLIRSEYKEAEEHVLSVTGFDQDAPGVVVTGQPGIGLSLSAWPRRDLRVFH